MTRHRTPRSLLRALPGFRRVFERFAPLIRLERGRVTLAVLALIAGVVLRLFEPWPLKFVFDRVLATRTRRSARLPDLPLLNGLNPMTVLAVAAVGLVVIIALRALSDYFSAVLFAVIGNRVLAKVRNQAYRHLQRLSLAFHTSSRGGDLIVRVINDVNQMRDAVVTAVLPLAANVLVLAGMWGMMLWLQWRLALLAMAVLPLLWFRTRYFGRRIREAARKQRQRHGAMASTASEAIGAIKVVQALSLEERFAADFCGRSDGSGRDDVKAAKLTARLARGVDVTVAVATAAVLYYGTLLALRHEMTPGELLVFLAYLRKAFNPVEDLAKYTGRLAKATAAGERVLDLLDHTPEVVDLPGAVEAPAFRGEVRFEGVSFSYEPGRERARGALNGLELIAPAGEWVAIVGPSGAGKSTAANLLLRLYDPTGGRVTIDRRDVREFTLESLRRQTSVVLQDSILFAGTIRENILHGRPDASEEDLIAAARAANAEEFIGHLPDGFDTVVGERGVTLSGGQRQRIAVARAAIRHARILILDEPTAGLDENSEREVVAALTRAGVGRTTLLITHDLRLAGRCDRVYYVEGGRVAESGAHDELLRAGGRYAALYQLQTAAEHLHATQSAAAAPRPPVLAG